MIGKLAGKIIGIAVAQPRMKKIQALLDSGLPQEMRPALEYLATGKCDPETKAVSKQAEDRRRAIASEGDKKVAIWYSPKPGTSGTDTSIDARPQPGKVIQFTMKRVAGTGKNQKWGTALYLIARGFESTIGFELGSCAGISAIFLSSVPSLEKLITVEGSKDLAEIAQESLNSHRNVKVVNSLFDEAIDLELPLLCQRINLAFIDGHHEKVATIHYFNRILPFLENGAVVIFDDISWSHDMREAWSILSNRPVFSHSMDLGALGVCILNAASESSEAEPTIWDLQPIVGNHSIGDPRGWKE